MGELAKATHDLEINTTNFGPNSGSGSGSADPGLTAGRRQTHVIFVLFHFSIKGTSLCRPSLTTATFSIVKDP